MLTKMIGADDDDEPVERGYDHSDGDDDDDYDDNDDKDDEDQNTC